MKKSVLGASVSLLALCGATAQAQGNGARDVRRARRAASGCAAPGLHHPAGNITSVARLRVPAR